MKKIWGVYNTFEDASKIDSLEEYEIWKKIDNLGGIIFYAFRDMDKSWGNNLSNEQLMQIQYNLEYLVYYTRKFGVEFSYEPNEKEHVESSESYRAWFKFWHDHFNSMPRDVYDKFVEDKLANKDVSSYLPFNKWNDSFKKTL